MGNPYKVCHIVGRVVTAANSSIAGSRLQYARRSFLLFYVTELPYNDYFEYYGPDFKLHISPSNMTNQNTPEYLDKIKTRLFENLRMLPHAPGVQMQGMLLKLYTCIGLKCNSSVSCFMLIIKSLL